jgi:hypothetical protein
MDNYEQQTRWNAAVNRIGLENEANALRWKADGRLSARVAVVERALRLAFSEAPDLFAGLDPATLAPRIVSLIADIENGRA